METKINNAVSFAELEPNYPEFPYPEESAIKEALLRALQGLGLNPTNPFETYVRSGQTALIKPNWVRDRNPLGFSIDSLVSHPSLVVCIIEFLAVAMKGEGTIVVADAPLQNCNFENLKKEMHISEIVESFRDKYPKMIFIIEDWRITVNKGVNTLEKTVQDVRLADENAWGSEYKIIDTGAESLLEDISKYADRFRVTKYKKSLLQKHHAPGKHEYLVAKRVLEADFVINLPKMKTHIKAGLTCAMKNLIGINGHKEFLPHHIKGSYFEGGDNYSSSSFFRRKYEDLYDYVWENINIFPIWKRKLYMRSLQFLWFLSLVFGAENISAGSWMGNDTIWRTTLDLNHIVYYKSATPRKVLNIVDGVIAGQGEGPLEPTPRPLGVIIVGENPAYVDAVVAKMMGYVIARIPTVYHAIYNRKSKFGGEFLEQFFVNKVENGHTQRIKFSEIAGVPFVKPQFWKGAE